MLLSRLEEDDTYLTYLIALFHGFFNPIGTFSPYSADPLPAFPKKQLILKIISGQQLPKPPDSMLGDRGEVKDINNTVIFPYAELLH